MSYCGQLDEARGGGSPLMNVPGLFYNAKTFKDVPAGTVIFEEGASGTEMFGVVEGEVEVRLPNGAVRRLGPGDTFGEMASSIPPPEAGRLSQWPIPSWR
jgi:hypothetical protein